MWQIGAQTGLLSTQILPEPLKVLTAAVTLTLSGELLEHMQVSAGRAIGGFLVGGSIGFFFGLLNGLLPIAEKLTDTTLQMVRNIPNLALIPMFIVWFGIGETSKIVLIASSVFFPIYVNTFHGIRTVDPNLIEMGKVYGLRGVALFRKIVFPGALSSILVGLRFSLGVMWLTLIVTETIAANAGIGYMSANAREFMKMDVVVLSVLIYALFGKLSDSIARALERKFLRWHPNYQQ